MTGALDGWRVLVPHAGEWGDRVSALLAEHGATATVVPLIRFEPPEDLTGLDDAVRRLADGAYAWLVVTSGTTVGALAGRAAAVLGGSAEDALVRAVGATPVAAVGPGTARALDRHGVRVALVPEGERSASGLVAELPDAVVADPSLPASPGAGNLVLHPRSDLSDRTLSTGLQARGWQVDDPVAYRTVTGAPEEGLPDRSAAELREEVRSGAFQAVLFSSGSTVRGALDVVGAPPPGTVVACIGPRTEQAALDGGLTVHVLSRTASAEGLVEALARHAEEAR